MKLPRRLVLVVVSVILGACGRGPKLEEHKTGTFSAPQTFGLRNLTVVRVDPAGRTVAVDWKGYNVQTGNAFNVPFEEVVFSSGSEKYRVSDRQAGNNELVVNGRLFRFDSSREQLLIRFGAGVSVEPGGDYGRAVKGYDHGFWR